MIAHVMQAANPAEVLALLGVEPGMDVIDLIAAGGMVYERIVRCGRPRRNSSRTKSVMDARIPRWRNYCGTR